MFLRAHVKHIRFFFHFYNKFSHTFFKQNIVITSLIDTIASEIIKNEYKRKHKLLLLNVLFNVLYNLICYHVIDSFVINSSDR